MNLYFFGYGSWRAVTCGLCRPQIPERQFPARRRWCVFCSPQVTVSAGCPFRWSTGHRDLQPSASAGVTVSSRECRSASMRRGPIRSCAACLPVGRRSIGPSIRRSRGFFTSSSPHPVTDSAPGRRVAGISLSCCLACDNGLIAGVLHQVGILVDLASGMASQ